MLKTTYNYPYIIPIHMFLVRVNNESPLFVEKHLYDGVTLLQKVLDRSCSCHYYDNDNFLTLTLKKYF